MRNILILLTIGSFFIMNSCNEDEFLLEEPRDDIFAENLYVNYSGFVNGLNALYSIVRMDRINAPAFTRGGMWKAGTDNAFVNRVSGTSRLFMNYNDLNSENRDVVNNFNWLYGIINSANLIINRAENYEVDWMGTNDSENLKNQNYVIGQARLIRAWAYRHLKYGWGAVPLSLEEISGSTYRNDWIRNPVSEINAQMEIDLTFARDNLAMIEETGAPNSAVASTMLAELYLEMGDNGKAETEALRVINNGQYKLMTSRFGINKDKPGNAFSDIFDNANPESDNEEVLWVLNNAYSDVVGSVGLKMRAMWLSYYGKDSELKKLNLFTLYTYNGGKGTGRASVTDSAFAWYEPFDDRYSEYCVKKYFIYPADAAATTFDTVRYTTTDYSNSGMNNSYLWPSVRKWEYVDPYVLENASQGAQYDDLMFMRLAETYLLAAEAMMNQGKNDLAAEYLNTLRARSNASLISGSDVTLDFILKERSRELVTEEYRRHTLVRTGKFYEWTLKYNRTLDESKVNPWNNLFPIPLGIIQSNTGAVMEQNPGYN
jgi:hypothetical protein